MNKDKSNKKPVKKIKDDIDEDIQKLETEVAELKDGWRRTQADFENFRNRTQREKADLIKCSNEELISDILPILDNFEIALKHKPKDLEGNEYIQGLEYVKVQMQQVLEKYGLSKIEIKTGDEFDHNLAEAVEQIESKEYKSGKIVEILQNGYKIDQKIIRPARVKVSK